MNRIIRGIRRASLPLGVFGGVMAIHYLWSGLFPEQDPIQNCWAPLASSANLTWLHAYLSSQSYWLGYSYALSLAFTAAAIRRYREERLSTDRNLALGGITLTGFLALAACFLTGCCGSPMLVVYLNLFGAAFLPVAKPLMAALTTVTLLGAWFWMKRGIRQARPGMEGRDSCHKTDCKCD